MVRTTEEINELRTALLKQRAAVPEFSGFGDPNHEIIDGQIRVLDGDFDDTDEIYDYFGGDSTADDYEEEDDKVAIEVVRALDWLNGDIEADELVDEEYLQQ